MIRQTLGRYLIALVLNAGFRQGSQHEIGLHSPSGAARVPRPPGSAAVWQLFGGGCCAFLAGCSGDRQTSGAEAEGRGGTAPGADRSADFAANARLAANGPANGNVGRLAGAVIGPEIANYRITDVRVQVGDRVKKGSVLARIADDTVASEQAEAKAAVAELEASAAEAKANAERARRFWQGFYSAAQHPVPDGAARHRPGWPPARPVCRRRRCAWARPPCWRRTTA